MLSLHSLRFDTSELKPLPDCSNNFRAFWLTPANDIVLLEYLPGPPLIPVALKDYAGLRSFYQSFEDAEHILELDTIEIQGLKAVRLLYKSHSTEGLGLGFNYTGGLTFLFRDHSFRFYLRCRGGIPSGVRETMVTLKLTEQELDALPDWLRSHEDVKTRIRRAIWQQVVEEHLADQECFDEVFPQHALSRWRKLFPSLQASLQFDPELYRIAPFRGPHFAQGVIQRILRRRG